MAYRCSVLLLAAGTLACGCSVFDKRPEQTEEYRQALGEIESYEDADGNYIRPEGLKADRRKQGLFGSDKNLFGGSKIDRPEAKRLYAEGDALFQQATNAQGNERAKLFQKAADRYEDAAKEWKSSALEQDAWLMAAEAKFFAEDYTDAEDFYVRLMRDYPRNRYVDLIDKRRMEIALYWIRHHQFDPKPLYVINFTDDKRPWSDTGGHGRRMLEKLRLDSPIGRYTDDATMELANAAFQRGKYQDAADFYSDLRTTYPDSPHQFDAHFLGLKALMETYRGAEYDATPLVDSEKLLQQMVKRFPEESRREKDFVNEMYGQLQYQQAERLMVAARFRINRGENLSAARYLDRVILEYDKTPFVEEAKLARASFADEPLIPEPPMQWIDSVIPTTDKIVKATRDVPRVDPTRDIPASPIDSPIDSSGDSDAQIAEGPSETIAR